MWHDWSEAAIEQDFTALKEQGLRALRIFPIWPDFQPLEAMCRARREIKAMYLGGQPLDNTPEGKAGVDPVVAGRFRRLLELAEEHGIDLMVEMITGWMSGRAYVPAVFQGRNVLTDPLALRWEVRLVEYLVRTARSSKAVIAWGLGNEVNCLDGVSRDEAWAWTALITRTIRSLDTTRPIVSGMHSLAVNERGQAWSMEDQGEHNDVTTIHPYPFYTPHCHRDGLTGIRTILHAPAESRLTADISGKPCLSQEVGVLGPMIGSDALSADYLRSVLWSLWAAEDLGCLWWLAYDSDHEEPPYEWQANERELGLMTQDRKPKPVAGVLRAFGDLLQSLPEHARALPKHRKEALCILTEEQDNWGVAYAAYTLAKAAGFDLGFATHRHEWPEADVYLMPSCSSASTIYGRHWRELLRRVEAGATLYLSLSNAFISSFKEITGVEIRTRRERRGPVELRADGLSLRIPTSGVHIPLAYELEPRTAEVLATEPDGNPVFCRNQLGKGCVYFLGTSLETGLSNTPGVYEDPDNDFSALYRIFGASALGRRLVQKPAAATHLHLSEHPVPGSSKVLVVGINHTGNACTHALTLRQVRGARALHGDARLQGSELSVHLPAHDGFVVELDT